GQIYCFQSTTFTHGILFAWLSDTFELFIDQIALKPIILLGLLQPVSGNSEYILHFNYDFSGIT
ncbi:MAG: hypothetical protein ABGX37_05845, partial [Methylococcales bacterium]